MVEIGRILTLDNGKEYVVVSYAKYMNDEYVYLVNLYDENETKICICKNDELTELIDNDILDHVEKNLFKNLIND